jgi:hypothetical protein
MVAFTGMRKPTPDQADQARIAYSMFDKPEHPIMIETPEQTPDIKFKNPVILPASLARNANGIQSRFSWPVTIGIWKENRI